MTLKINKRISKYNHDVSNNRKIKKIIIHWVGAVSTAKNNADYFYNADRGASAHYFVDDTSIWQSVLDKNIAWAVGSKGWLDQGSPYAEYGHKYWGKYDNTNTLSIEMCCKKNANGKLIVTEKTIQNTSELVKDLLKKYNLNENDVIRHFDINGKLCPGIAIKEEDWNRLHAKLVGKFFKIKTKVKLIAKKTYSRNSKQTRILDKDTVYGIIDTKKDGDVLRGKTVKGDWISLTSNYVSYL